MAEQSNEKKEYNFGGIKEFNLVEIEKEVLNDSVYLDVFAGSDLAFKENVQSLLNPLESLKKLDGVLYNYKAETGLDTELRPGFIAQNVEKVVPLAVAVDDSGLKYVNYSALAPMLVESVKELARKVEDQALEIAELKSKLQNK